MSTPVRLHTTVHGPLRITCREGVDERSVLGALASNGTVLKASRKAVIRRVGTYVLKDTRGLGPRTRLKHLLHPARQRRGWIAALTLENRGVPVPKPLALVEECGLFGVRGNVTVSEYLVDHSNIEDFIAKRIDQGCSRHDVHAFLLRIARAVAAMTDAGVVHTDLAGKNILTADGENFVFIDLDGIEIDAPYTDERRFRNHLQLYDSLLDYAEPELLGDMILVLLPAHIEPDPWIGRIVAAQARRRERTLRKWAIEGRTKGA